VRCRGAAGSGPGRGKALLSAAPPQDCYLITEQLQTNYMLVTPKPGSGNGSAGCQAVHACTGAHPHTTRPPPKPRERRWDASRGRHLARETSPAPIPAELALRASVSPLVAGLPQPCPPPQHPLHPKSTDSGSASEHPHPTGPIPLPSRRALVPWDWELWSVQLHCPPASSWEPEQPREPTPSRARAMVAPGPGPPCSWPPQTPP